MDKCIVKSNDSFLAHIEPHTEVERAKLCSVDILPTLFYCIDNEMHFASSIQSCERVSFVVQRKARGLISVHMSLKALMLFSS